MLNEELKNINSSDNISNTLINIGGRIGALMDVTNESLDPKSQSGEEISNVEKDKGGLTECFVVIQRIRYWIYPLALYLCLYAWTHV